MQMVSVLCYRTGNYGCLQVFNFGVFFSLWVVQFCFEPQELRVKMQSVKSHFQVFNELLVLRWYFNFWWVVNGIDFVSAQKRDLKNPDENSNKDAPSTKRNASEASSGPPQLPPRSSILDDSFGAGGWRNLFYPSMRSRVSESSQPKRRPHSYNASAADSFEDAGYLRYVYYGIFKNCFRISHYQVNGRMIRTLF